MKYGVTLRTIRQPVTRPSGVISDEHNVILCKSLDRDQAYKLFHQLGYAYRLLFGRVADEEWVDHLHRNRYSKLIWRTPPGQPGDDLMIFIDEYEDE